MYIHIYIYIYIYIYIVGGAPLAGACQAPRGAADDG